MSDDAKRPGGPVLIDLSEDAGEAAPSPSEVPPVPEADGAPDPAMVALAEAASGEGSPLRRWFLGLGGAFLSLIVGIAIWEFIAALIAQSAVLGGALAFLFALVLLLGAALVVRELSALSRLSQLEKVRQTAEEVLRRKDLEAARKLATRLAGFYRDRVDMRWSAGEMESAVNEAFDADAVLGLTERQLMADLDARAVREIEAASRQVATVTALVPLAMADLLVALFSNLRMIRRIAEIYGGRAGTLGAWRLVRSVMTHLVATGALAVGDDMIGSIAGGGVMSRISRRFGEGLVNGALTARVGVAALEVCRPLPFAALPRPSVSRIVKRALTGLFGTGEAETGKSPG